MTLFVLDTDHLSLFERNHPIVVGRLVATQEQLTTTAINVEEQLRGRLKQVADAKEGSAQEVAYQRLTETVVLLAAFPILPYHSTSYQIYQTLKAQRIRIGTQDLRIASITLAHNGILLRNEN